MNGDRNKTSSYKRNKKVKTVYKKRSEPVRRIPERPKPAPTVNLQSLALWSLVLVLMLVYLGGYIYSYLSRPKIIETLVVFGSVDQTDLFDGIIVRDEEVYRSGYDGVVVYNLNDYDRVKKDGGVCSIQESQAEKIEEDLTKINKNIISMQEDREEYLLFDDDIKAANSQIKKAADELSFSLSENNVQTLYSMSEKITQTLDVRNQMLFTENRGNTKSLIQERDVIESQLSSAKHPVSSSSSGIVSYLTDGLESILTVDGLDTISMEQTLMKVNYDELKYSKEVSSGDPVFKIIKSSDWYIAAYIDKPLTSDWAENASKTIYIKNGDTFDLLDTVIHKIENTGEKTYVVFRSNKKLVDYLDCRNLTFKVEQGVVEGLKIPNSAIVDKTLLKIPKKFVFEENGKNSVTKKTADKEETIPVTFTDSDDEYYYVLHDYNNLRYDDTLVSGGEYMKITETENIKGVYVTNSGATVFKRIVPGGNYSENATHTILDPSLNKGLKVQDRIVTDAKYIAEKQLVY